MPLYEYRCRSCDHQFEVQQSFSDDPLTVCPECEGALRKVFNPVGISFKGSGFYKNDSRGSASSSSGSEGGSNGGSSSSGASGDSTTSSDSGSGSDGSGGSKQPAAATSSD
jgi:putative FmdB family regulatory protein